ncbi:MAG: T9SS type A sorting domain-containing protein [Janthinobacterium lividum]
MATLTMSFVWKKEVSLSTESDSIPSRFQIKTDHYSYLKSGLKVAPIAAKTAQNQSTATTSKQNTIRIENEKLLTDVSIFPNPITDKLNLTYNVKKNTNVSIKIMDVLGNEVVTLLSQRVEAGEQKNSFQLSNRLSSGFYFVRMIVGTESVIKRISVL